MFIFQFLILQVVVFGAVIFFLRKILYGNTESAITRLGTAYQDLLAKQKEMTEKIVASEKEYQDKKTQSQGELEQMKVEAIDAARKKEDEIVKKAKDGAEEILAKAQASREQFYHEIEIELSKKMIEFVRSLMTLVFSKKMMNMIHEEWIVAFLEKAKDFDLSSVVIQVDHLIVRTAFALKPEEKEKLAAFVMVKLSRPMKIEEVVEEELMAGYILQFGTLLLDGTLANSFKEAAEKYKEKIEKGT